MSSSSFLQDYDLIEPTIRKLYDSRLRLAILDSLSEKPMRLADLRREVDSNAPNTSSKAKDLEEMGLIERLGSDYKLTPWGQAVSQRLRDSFYFYGTLEKFRGFWDTHYMEGIPLHFLSRLGELYNSELVACSKQNPIATHETLIEYLGTVKKEMFVMSPILQKEWGAVLAGMIQKGIKMEYLFPESLIKYFVSIITPEILELYEKNTQFYKISDADSVAGFVTSDSFFCISTESRSVPGNYMDMKLYSTDKKAIKFGHDLYAYFKKKAMPVSLYDYK